MKRDALSTTSMFDPLSSAPRPASEPVPAFNEDELVRSICQESFYEFVKEFWSTLIPDEPTWNWHIEYLCDELQKVAERVFRKEEKLYDLVINISPGSTKSTIASHMFPAWVWTRMPRARMICASYAHPLAMELSRKCRALIKSEKYVQTFGIKLTDDQDTKSHFENTKKGQRYAVGSGGAVTGMHGDFIIVDDPINPLEIASAAEIKSTNRWMSETLATRKTNKLVTPLILIMQRLHQDDPAGNLLERMKGTGKLKHINLPAELTDAVRPTYLKERYVDGLMDPIRLPRHVLESARKELGEFGYAGQFLQSPIPMGGGMFKTDRLVFDNPPPLSQFTQLVRYWDKAGSAGKGCFTVGALLGRAKDGRIWILDIVRGQWDSAKRESVILQTAQMDGKDVLIGIEQEPGSGGKESAESTVRRLLGFRVRVDKPTGDKAMRADPFSVQVNHGNVSIKQGAAWVLDYVEEMRYFPSSRYMDQIDASSAAFATLAQPVRRAGAL